MEYNVEYVREYVDLVVLEEVLWGWNCVFSEAEHVTEAVDSRLAFEFGLLQYVTHFCLKINLILGGKFIVSI